MDLFGKKKCGEKNAVGGVIYRMKKIIFRLLTLISAILFFSAGMCTKVAVYGTDTNTDAVVKIYNADLYSSADRIQKAIESLGYAVTRADDTVTRFTTAWKLAPPDSHYSSYFNRKDFSASLGAYYQLVVEVTDLSPRLRVSVSTQVKSVAGKLTSANVLEKKILARIDDFLRSPQIEMTNVGVTNR